MQRLTEPFLKAVFFFFENISDLRAAMSWVIDMSPGLAGAGRPNTSYQMCTLHAHIWYDHFRGCFPSQLSEDAKIEEKDKCERV